MTYREVAHTLYKERVYPEVLGCASWPEVLYRDAYLYYLEPQEEGGPRTRYHPSALLLLIRQALQPERDLQTSEVSLAAAVEIWHASTLIVDDFVDRHEWRRGARSLRNAHGDNIALLVAHQQVTHSLQLALDAAAGAQTYVREFVSAMREGYAGELADEPESWKRVTPQDWMGHWQTTTQAKQVVGHLAAKLGTIAAGREDVLDEVATMEAEMSFLAQLLNDAGDVFGYRGFQVTTGDTREQGEESRTKPLHPKIWLSERQASDVTGLDDRALAPVLRDRGYVQELARAVREHQAMASARLRRLNLPPSPHLDALLDFIHSPDVPDCNG